MSSLLRKLGRMLRLAAFAAVVVGVVRAVLGMKKPAVTGEASWQPLADETTAATAATTSTRPKNDTTAPKPVAAKVPSVSEHDWIEPVDGACPASHPIKANAQSKIFHVPSGASYGRTVAERCYSSAEAAEADGFRAAKR